MSVIRIFHDGPWSFAVVRIDRILGGRILAFKIIQSGRHYGVHHIPLRRHVVQALLRVDAPGQGGGGGAQFRDLEVGHGEA